jgi:PAS domain S-box-containing protein
MKTHAGLALVGDADPQTLGEHVIELADFIGDFLWEVNAKGEYTFVGGGVEEMLGYRPEELLGRHYLDIIAPEQRHIVGRAAAEAFDKLERVHNLRNELVARDGHRVTVLTNGEPILSPDGRLVGFRGADRDVTDLFARENELRRFKSAIDTSNFGVAMSTPSGELTYVNESFARDHGYTPDELIGRPISVLHSAGQMPTIERLLAGLRASGRMPPVEVEHLRRDGSTFPMLMVGSMVRDDNGRPVGMTVSALDITD